MTVEFDASEVAKLAADLGAAGAKAEVRTEAEVLTEASNELYRRSQADVPVDSGTLKASGEKRGGKGWREVRYTATNKQGKPYSSFVEFGTYKDAPQPYLYSNVAPVERDMFEAMVDIADDTLR